MGKNIFLLSLSISLTLQIFIPIYDVKDNISSLNTTLEEDNYFETVVRSTIKIMKNYAYINILKSPPKVNGYDYFQKVDIIIFIINKMLTGIIHAEKKSYGAAEKLETDEEKKVSDCTGGKTDGENLCHRTFCGRSI